APAPVPPAVAASLTASAGAAGAVVTVDGRATVTWQPGAVPAGSTVGLGPAVAPLTIPGTAVSLTLDPAGATPPWPLDVDYAAAPSGQVGGFSTDGRTWRAVPALRSDEPTSEL